MKLTIDLNDPALQKQLETAIDAKLNELVADRIQGVIDAILDRKTSRMTDAWLESKVEGKIEQKVSAAFVNNWSGPGEFRQVLAVITEKVLREQLRKS